jgi:hypothetical protein
VTFVLGAAITVWATSVSPTITDLNGNVGVGSTNPVYKLHLEGTSVSDTIYLTLNQRNGYLPGAGNWLMFSQSAVPTQNFRIGYNNDDLSFQIRDMNDAKIATFQSGGVVKFEGTSVGDTIYLTLNQRNGYVPGAGNWIRFSQGSVPVQNARIGWSNSNQGFQIRDADDATIATFRTGGAVGIGTANPAAMLHVAGNVQVDGNIAAKYQDVAEWVKASGSPAEGTVVVIDATDQNGVVASNAPYDTRVAGVVSPKPGLLLGEPGKGRAKVAHSGRVKVKVDAKYGSIAIGDLLVTSSTPGYAMRSEPVSVGGVAIHRPGTLIGKALEPLAEGQGEILVLLTLQ